MWSCIKEIRSKKKARIPCFNMYMILNGFPIFLETAQLIRGGLFLQQEVIRMSESYEFFFNYRELRVFGISYTCNVDEDHELRGSLVVR
jgi:hypothetical protein